MPLFATCTSPIMNLICPPNLCFSSILGIKAVPREIEKKAHAKFWRANKVSYGRCTVAYTVNPNVPLLKIKD